MRAFAVWSAWSSLHPSWLCCHATCLTQVAMSFPDAFSSGQDGLVRRWSLQDSCCLQEFQAHQDAVRWCPAEWVALVISGGSNWFPPTILLLYIVFILGWGSQMTSMFLGVETTTDTDGQSIWWNIMQWLMGNASEVHGGGLAVATAVDWEFRSILATMAYRFPGVLICLDQICGTALVSSLQGWCYRIPKLTFHE